VHVCARARACLANILFLVHFISLSPFYFFLFSASFLCHLPRSRRFSIIYDSGNLFPAYATATVNHAEGPYLAVDFQSRFSDRNLSNERNDIMKERKANIFDKDPGISITRKRIVRNPPITITRVSRIPNAGFTQKHLSPSLIGLRWTGKMNGSIVYPFIRAKLQVRYSRRLCGFIDGPSFALSRRIRA